MVEIYCDSGDLEIIEKFSKDDRIQGFTTNPSLLKKAGITKYMDFAQRAVSVCSGKPISLEVLADDFDTMEKQARKLASLASFVYVKIPITNALGKSSNDLICELSGFNLNVTAVMTHDQVEHVLQFMKPHHIVSIFNGRITDPQRGALQPIRPEDGPKYLWASARQVGNVHDAKRLKYDIITLTPDLIAKLPLNGKDLSEYSLETVKQFYEDGKGIEF